MKTSHVVGIIWLASMMVHHSWLALLINAFKRLMPRNDPPSKFWWSLSKTSSQDARQDYSDEKRLSKLQSITVRTPGFRSFAQAIGLKQKKPCQHSFSVSSDSPSVISDSMISPSPTLLPADSIESLSPFHTPQRPNRPLLSLADDPVAGSVPAVSISTTRSPTDTSRLSPHSTSSGTDLASGKTFSRSSYASSSTTCHSYAIDNSSPESIGPSQALPEGNKIQMRMRYVPPIPLSQIR